LHYNIDSDKVFFVAQGNLRLLVRKTIIKHYQPLWKSGILKGIQRQIKMNRDIKSIVEQCPLLHIKLNKGERHRIMRNGIGRGSLWVTPKSYYNSVTTTGEVATLINDLLCRHFGAETGEDHHNYKYWNNLKIGDVSEIIRYFGK
jgi:hypothetical protein